jgi:Holliday junction resolvase-like predicted endonuclease
MREQDDIVFVEVKTRHGESAGRAEDAVPRSKARKMLAAGEWYITTHPECQELFWRCDLIAITISPVNPPEVAHYINAIVIG